MCHSRGMDTLIESRPGAGTALSRERMVTVLDALSYGLMPSEGCPACRATLANRCRECAQALADAGAVNAGIAQVKAAATEAEALAAYTSCVFELPRLGTGAVRDEQSRRPGLRKVRREHYLARWRP